jgi:hypothetical protein
MDKRTNIQYHYRMLILLLLLLLLLFMHYCDCSSLWKSCLSGYCLDADLRKRYLVTEVLNMWEVSMGGSHTTILLHVSVVQPSSCRK